MATNISNTDLAKAYYRCMTPYAASPTPYLKIKRIIESVDSNIAESYEQNDTLAEVLGNVKGISKKTMQIVESILVNGFESTQQKCIDERINKMQDEFYSPRPTNVKIPTMNDDLNAEKYFKALDS